MVYIKIVVHTSCLHSATSKVPYVHILLSIFLPFNLTRFIFPFLGSVFGTLLLHPDFPDRVLQSEFFLDDFRNALASAEAFDAQLQTAGSVFSSDYADLLTLSVGQVLGSLDITIAHGNDGAWNFSDVKVFMKNMGSLGSDSV